ncbi:MAG TPA: glycerol kinase GlpK [Prolixibacteraceae bacterium]|nr:glycerol kinase GlpK [Prolixibacteraceae bacterium]
MQKYILSIDQSTTATKAVLFDNEGSMIAQKNIDHKQYFPNPGWVEHDAEEIYRKTKQAIRKVIEKSGISGGKIAALAITNQRETTVVWDRKTGIPVFHAIVWQDRRTADFCTGLKAAGSEKIITKKTGLLIDAYFSASKIRWILDHVEGVKERALKGELAFGTTDTWVIWNLTNGNLHITDVSNASRTMLFNIHTLKWDEELLKIFDIPASLLPEVVASSHVNGMVTDIEEINGVPIAGIAGDQQAALFGQMCTSEGMAKCTYGTGCFLVMNTGSKAIVSNYKLLTTIGWQIGNEVTYALEGSVFMGGAVIQWLRDGLEFFDEAPDSEALANQVEDSGGVVFVPSLTGLGAPHWDPYARGSIFGITRGTTKAHVTRAALESICFQVNEVIETMKKDSGESIAGLRVDGGAAANNLMLQFQADISEIDLVRSTNVETTALGVAYLAGLAVGMWKIEELQEKWHVDKVFQPSINKEETEKLKALWSKAVERTKHWIDLDTQSIN